MAAETDIWAGELKPDESGYYRVVCAGCLLVRRPHTPSGRETRHEPTARRDLKARGWHEPSEWYCPTCWPEREARYGR